MTHQGPHIITKTNPRPLAYPIIYPLWFRCSSTPSDSATGNTTLAPSISEQDSDWMAARPMRGDYSPAAARVPASSTLYYTYTMFHPLFFVSSIDHIFGRFLLAAKIIFMFFLFPWNNYFCWPWCDSEHQPPENYFYVSGEYSKEYLIPYYVQYCTFVI